MIYNALKRLFLSKFEDDISELKRLFLSKFEDDISELNMKTKNANALIERMKEDHKSLPDMKNILFNVHELERKFEVLTNCLGVEIVSKQSGLPPEIVSISEYGLYGEAKKYINSSQEISKAVNIYLESLELQTKIYAKILRDLNKKKI